MAYVHRAISDEEELIAFARPHWIYLAKALFWSILSIFIGFWIDGVIFAFWERGVFSVNPALAFLSFPNMFTYIPWFGIGLGLVLFWTYFATYISTEVGLTNQRYIYKKGLFFISTEQVDLEDIRAEDVHHGLLGWLFRYGYVHLDALFTEDLYLPAIAHPYPLIKASHKARARRPQTKYDKEQLEVNLERVDQQEKASRTREKLRRLHDGLLQRFRKAA